ncbi:short-chain dehydrogenase [Glonium stellatum]|uniref:Short-chain dehydrogenase n=1 Tax=Glonium stellatum TaxID=574774 RepID=A0A8E2FA90_9PEZI|nr:short-chain dehydrogenase [Glonium stellatum]
MSFLELVKVQRQKLPIFPKPCEGQTFIVTGANVGLGLEAAKHFAAQSEIESEAGRTGVAEVWHLDLASSNSVLEFGKRAVAELDRIDAVIENASVGSDSWSQAEGMETTITVNVIGIMLLAMLLLPKLKEPHSVWNNTPHLTFVTSALAFESNFFQQWGKNIFAPLNVKEKANTRKKYHISKLLQVYAARELAARLPESQTGIVINLINPGLCWTNLAHDASFSVHLQLYLLRLLLARTAEVGSRTVLHATTARPSSHGKFCSDCQIKESWVPAWIYSDDGRKTQTQVWNELVMELQKIELGCVDSLWRNLS